jgi:hypothetical protein
MARKIGQANRKLAQIVESRVGIGHSDMVSGWHTLLDNLFKQMGPYLQKGRLITFKTLQENEKRFFERLYHQTVLPENAVGFYLPPSVRRQMMGEDAGAVSAGDESDAGAVVASLTDNHDVIVNALFALAPYTPAVDVYEQGKMIAGYQFSTIDECRADLQRIIQRHLSKSFPLASSKQESLS